MIEPPTFRSNNNGSPPSRSPTVCSICTYTKTLILSIPPAFLLTLSVAQHGTRMLAMTIAAIQVVGLHG